MMVKTIAIILLGAAMSIAAGPDPKDFALWTATELPSPDKKLAVQGESPSVTVQRLGKYDNHTVLLLHRDADGEAELHEILTDVMFVQSGEATLVIGGTVVKPRNTDPHETRGEGIMGG